MIPLPALPDLITQDSTGLNMDATQRPDPDSALNRVGHVIISFPPKADVQGALSALFDAGFSNDEVIVYSAEQMKRQARLDIANAGMLASIGQDLNLMKADLQHAEQAFSFLVVRASQDEKAAVVAVIARRFNARRAQKYGLLLIEELLASGSDEHQVFESVDRGLDEPAAAIQREGASR